MKQANHWFIAFSIKDFNVPLFRILGNFTDCRNDVGYESVESMLRGYIAPYNIPLLCRFPAGHEKLNLPVVIGAPAIMEVRADGATLSFDIPGDNIIIGKK